MARAMSSVGRSPDNTNSIASTSGNDALEQVIQDFKMKPRETSAALAAQLTIGQRAALAAALAQHTDQQNLDEKYFGELFAAADDDANSELNK